MINYNTQLNKAVFESFIKDLQLKQSQQPKEFTCLLGVGAMELMNLSMMGVNLTGQYWITRFKNCKNIIYINVFDKAGLYKIKVNIKNQKNKITTYKGTQKLRSYKHYKSAFKALKQLKDANTISI